MSPPAAIRRRAPAALAVAAIALGTLSACHDPKPVAPAAVAAEAAGERAGKADCGADPRVTPWQPGLTVAGSAHRVVIVSTVPPGAQVAGSSAPTMGANTLTVSLVDAAGKMVSDATLEVAASMPDHGHGPSLAAGQFGGGYYVFRRLDLFMPGVWRLDFIARRVGQADDTATVTLCIAG